MRKVIVGAVVILFSFFLGHIFAPFGLIGFLVGVVLIVMGAVQASSSSSNTSTTEGFGAGFTYSFESNNTGIALSTDRQVVKLKEKKNIKEYAFTDIREWECNLASGGEIVFTGGSFSGGMAVLGENRRNKNRNVAASGLFVTVRDIDNPVWRVEMLDKKSQQRWMEIMRQCVNESPVAASS